MEHVAIVNRRQPRADLARDLGRLVRRQPPDASQQRRQVFAIHELHGQERRALRLADVVHAAHVRVTDLPRESHLAQEELQAFGPAVVRVADELECDRLPDAQVLGAEHFAHAAMADALDDAIAASEDGAG